MQTKAQLLIFALLVAIFYGNTLQNGFVHDDVWQVATNKQIISLSSLGKIFTTCIAEDLLGGCKNIGFYYRPMQYVAYLFTNLISPTPAFFHFMNLVYFFIGGVLVFFLFRLLLPGNVYPVVATIIYLIHPVNSEVVNWVSAVPELLILIYGMLSLILYIKYTQKRDLRLLLLSSFFLFLALFSKETSIVFLLILLFYEIIFKKIKTDSINVKKYFLTAIVLITPLLIYLFARSLVLGRVVYKYVGYYELNTWQQVINTVYLYPKYLLKLVFPLPLSFQELVIPKLALDSQMIFFIITLGVLGGLGILGVRYKLKNILFALVLINIPLLPALLFINKLGEFIFSERYLFISTVGFALLIMELARLLLKKFRFTPQGWKAKYLRLGLLGIFGVLVVASFFVVFNRNKDWKDNFASYQAMLRIDSANKKAHFQLGNIYFQKGQIKLAKEEYQQALEIDKNYQEASAILNNISNYFKNKNLSFYYSKAWELKNKSGQISLVNGKNTITISLEGIQDDKEYGTLVNQGEALIPNVDRAYVKVWNPPAGGQVFQFSLFKGSRVLTIIVDPASEDSLNAFNNMVSTLKIR